MKKTLYSFLVVFVFGCLFIPTSHAVEGYYPVSLIQLVAIPDQYVDQKVKVKGFFEFGMFAAIYPNHLSAEIRDTASAVEVSDQTGKGDLTRSCDKKYVAISGRFVEHEKHYEITDIVEVLDVKSLKPCWVMLKSDRKWP